MREIKFRYKYGNEFRYYTLFDLMYGWSEKSINHPEHFAGQYTGLKDKNGKEIYEGDILDFDEEEWGTGFIPEVITLEKILGEFNLNGTKSDIGVFRQVIGNVYQNSELLNE